MSKFNSTTLLLVASVALVGLSGCEQVEQAANDVVEKAKQATVLALDEAHQSGSIGQAKETANQVLQEARQQAAGLLGQASEYLSRDQQGQDDGGGKVVQV
jgi:thioredoxin-like negative regulator of GroEL